MTKSPSEKPTPTHYMTLEGMDWIPWPSSTRLSYAHAIKFSDGSIFDMVNGWRPCTEEKPKLNRHSILGELISKLADAIDGVEDNSSIQNFRGDVSRNLRDMLE